MTATVLVLRTSNADGTSRNGFDWPESGPVEAPDWQATAECGHGLHGALWGEGDGSLFRWESDAVWQVVEVEAASVVDLDGKVKFPRGIVVHTGTRETATAYVADHGGQGRPIIGGTATAGNDGTASAGDGGTATAGNDGTATAGDGGTATAGYRGTATAGHRGTASAGDGGTATAGNHGTATAGDGGTATAGNHGTATAGNYGTATAGYRGTATAGNDGTATAGDGGDVRVRWHDGVRYRLAVGYVGEDGIEPGVAYRVVDGKLSAVTA